MTEIPTEAELDQARAYATPPGDTATSTIADVIERLVAGREKPAHMPAACLLEVVARELDGFHCVKIGCRAILARSAMSSGWAGGTHPDAGWVSQVVVPLRELATTVTMELEVCAARLHESGVRPCGEAPVDARPCAGAHAAVTRVEGGALVARLMAVHDTLTPDALIGRVLQEARPELLSAFDALALAIALTAPPIADYVVLIARDEDPAPGGPEALRRRDAVDGVVSAWLNLVINWPGRQRPVRTALGG